MLELIEKLKVFGVLALCSGGVTGGFLTFPL